MTLPADDAAAFVRVLSALLRGAGTSIATPILQGLTAMTDTIKTALDSLRIEAAALGKRTAAQDALLAKAQAALDAQTALNATLTAQLKAMPQDTAAMEAQIADATAQIEAVTADIAALELLPPAAAMSAPSGPMLTPNAVSTPSAA